MRVANYYRVSTKLQENKFSLSAQKSELSSYVEKMNWTFVNEFVDVETGGKLDKKGLNALLDTVESGKVDVVLCMDQDRLSRLDTISWEYLKSVLRDNNVRIAEPNGTLTDLSNEDQEFMSDLRNLMAQREKKSVVRRMMYGKRQRLREGKGWGQCPFEYYYQDGFYYIKDGWAWTIPFIDDLYLNKNMGMKSISNELNKVSRTPTNRNWNEHLVHTRLVSKNFHGYQEMTFSNGETISSYVYEPMRSEETYNKIQSIRGTRGKQFRVFTRTSTENVNLLKYVPLACGLCSRTLSVQQVSSKEKPRYYAQHGRKQTFDGERCDILINAKCYEYNLVKALREILQSEEMASKYIQFNNDDNELSELNSKASTHEKTLKKLHESKDKLLDLYLTSDIEKDVYTKKDADLSNKIKLESESLNKIKRNIDLINEKEWNYENLYEYIEIASEIGTNLTRHEQAVLISKIFNKGVLYENELVLTTEIYKGVPVEVSIPIVDDVWVVNRQIKKDKEQGNVIFVE